MSASVVADPKAREPGFVLVVLVTWCVAAALFFIAGRMCGVDRLG